MGSREIQKGGYQHTQHTSSVRALACIILDKYLSRLIVEWPFMYSSGYFVVLKLDALRERDVLAFSAVLANACGQ